MLLKLAGLGRSRLAVTVRRWGVPMSVPYREPARPASGSPSSPAELVCTALDPDRRSRPGLAVLQLFLLPVIAGQVASFFAPAGVSVAVMLATRVLIVWSYRRGRNAQNCVLRVDGGELSVRLGRSRRFRACMKLPDLSDVVLDTKTIQRVVEGSTMVAGARYIESRTAPEVDVARIVLVKRDGSPAYLGERFLAHMNAVDGLGKIRVFLRKHGWVPDDERSADGEGEEGPTDASRYAAEDG